MKKLYLCTDKISICKKDNLYKIEQTAEDIFYVDDIGGRDRCILNKSEVEALFIPIVSMENAINIFISKIPNIKIHKAKRVTGSRAYNTYDERYEYYIKINEDTNILFTERGTWVDTKNEREYILCEAVATIQSNSQKINGLSFVVNLIVDDISNLIDTLEFLCK